MLGATLVTALSEGGKVEGNIPCHMLLGQPPALPSSNTGFPVGYADTQAPTASFVPWLKG